ncbi:MAG: GAF domain-containing protein [Chloroflexi bacterium]|nr:GAF domain-containing protein [Chloroflexota bacterium]
MRWLTNPSEHVRDIENRYQARLLASLLLAFIPLGLLSILIQLRIVPEFTQIFPILLGAVFVLIIAYLLSRTKFHKLGSFIVIVLPSVAVFANLRVDPAPTISITYVIFTILLSSVLLSWRWTVFFVGTTFVATILLITINPDMDLKMFAPSLGIIVITSGLILVFIWYQTALEGKRQMLFVRKERRYQMLINQSPYSTVIYDTNGRPRYYNQSAIDLWGLSEQDLEFFRSNYNILEDKQLENTGILHYINEALAGNGAVAPPNRYEFQRIDKSGNAINDVRWIVPHCYPVKDEAGNVLEIVIVHQDVTNQKRVENEIDHRNQELTLLNKVITVATSSLNKDEILQFVCDELATAFKVSHTVAVLVNHHKDNMVSIVATRLPQPSLNVIGMDIPIAPFLSMFTQSLPLTPNIPIAIKDIRDVVDWPEAQIIIDQLDISSVVILPLTIRDETIGAIGLASKTAQEFTPDMIQLAGTVTASVSQAIQNAQLFEDAKHYAIELEERVAERTIEIEAANTKLQALAIVKDEFVSNVSHELRTPITNIRLFHDLLNLNPSKKTEYMATVLREIERLEHIVESLLQISRLDQESVLIKLAAVNLNHLAELYTSDRILQAQEKHITLSFQNGEALPTVQADSKQLGQVLGVILTNALNYTPPGGEIFVRTDACIVDGRQWVTISVQDNGPGIVPEEQSYLFERFFRGKAGRENRFPGTGLGLSIAKEIIDRHNGRINVSSQGIPGQGTTVTVWLPVEESES